MRSGVVCFGLILRVYRFGVVDFHFPSPTPEIRSPHCSPRPTNLGARVQCSYTVFLYRSHNSFAAEATALLLLRCLYYGLSCCIGSGVATIATNGSGDASRGDRNEKHLT